MRKITFLAAMSFVLLTLSAARLEAATVCNDQNTVKAKVAAIDQAWVWNRYGALQPHGMMFALVKDLWVLGPNGSRKPDADHPLSAGNVILRPDKRPRPLVLRVNRGQCLEVELTNYLDPKPRNQFQIETPPHSKCPPNPVGGGCGEQTGERMAGFHPNGLALAISAKDDGSYVGANAATAAKDDGSYVGANDTSLVAPGNTTTYTYLAEHEGTFFAYSPASTTGGDGNGGSIFAGLFAAVHVEPKGSTWYRSQVRQDELEKATPRLARTGHPILDYSRLRILNDDNEILHSDLTAIIDTRDAEFEEGRVRDCIDQKNNVSRDPNVCADPKKPFREFTIIFHDESGAVQAFDEFDAPEACELDESSAECQKANATARILHSVRDGFAINYGTAGLGAEVLANRKKVGPVRDCPECMLEEFFLSSWAVGDPAMVVDLPANLQENGERPLGTYFPDDPSNVYHSYLNDRLIFRNLHAGPKEHHVFHLHAHQWLQTQYNPRSAYLDSQTIGPGGTYTYEIAYGGSGNRNRGPGDSIFHCHFYPHFAQGMWSLWRVHDVFEPGTRLEEGAWREAHLAIPVAKARALPDGEIYAGTPIPALVPLPAAALAPMPGPVEIVAGQLKASASQKLEDYPGYPFFVPAKAGHRPPEPPLDIADGHDGGLARHIVENGTVEADELIDGNKRSLNKTWLTLFPRYLDEKGEPGEKLAMDFHGQEQHKTVDWQGGDAFFDTNGLPPEAGAPFSNPCPKNTPVRKFQAAVFQLDLIFNKKGWHTPQARILALKDDVMPTLNGSRAPQPFFFRVNSGDCIEYQHSNIVPRVWEQDTFQIKTPTDIIGQHIHLVKFDVTSSDGGGNGFNYEDGTASYQEVKDRIHAIRRANKCSVLKRNRFNCPLAENHPWYGSRYPGGRVTVQRWYADPQIISTDAAGHQTFDKTLETVFTHDHFGASTHQQAGLYAGLIVEPAGSTFYDENGNEMGKRLDGGPTSWKAVIHDKDGMKLREFGILYQDFHIAYEKGNDTAKALNPPGQVAVNEARPNFLVQWDDRCKAWPHCPEAVSADDIGAASINYRSEPAPLRLLGKDGKTQAAGKEGDLTYLFQSIPRSDADLNRDPERYPLVGGKKQPSKWPVLSPGMGKYDPFTPLIELYDGERFKIRLLAGAHEHEHSFSLNGLSWRFMQYEPNSGQRSFITSALSEHHEIDGFLTLPGGGLAVSKDDRFDRFDHLFKIGASVDDTWYGNWGILRAYRKDLRVSHLAPFEETHLAMPKETAHPAFLGRDTSATSRTDLAAEFKRESMDKFQPIVRRDVATGALRSTAPSSSMDTYDQRMEDLRQMLQSTRQARVVTALAEPSMSELERIYARALDEETADFEETLDLVENALKRVDVTLQEDKSSTSTFLAMNQEPLPPKPTEDASSRLAGMRQRTAHLASLRDRIPKVIELAPEGATPAAGYDTNRLAVCPPDSPLRAFAVSAVAAKDVLLEDALIYHRFPSSGPPGTCPGGCRSGESWLSVSDPAALLYVRDRYLDPETQKLDPAYKVEPLILRANAGDCIEIHLSNRLPEEPAHIPGYNTLPNLVQNFNFNQLRVPSQVGIHVQGLRYHVGESDGINVGTNPVQTIAPGETRIYRYYAGRVEMREGQMTSVPVEFGVLNLMPADPIQQNSKGLLGALVIEPPGAIWAHDQVPAEPYTARTAMLISRASATVFTLDKHFFRDLVLVGQDDVNFNLDFSRGGKARYLRPVRRVAQASHCRNAGCFETPVQDEEVDSVDSGHKAFNYRSEALWMRRGLSAALPLSETLALPAYNLLSDSFVGEANQTPRFCVQPGAPTRLRVAFPGGHGRNHVLHVHGHSFFELPFRDDSTVLGGNDWTNIKGSQDGMGPGSYYNFLFTDDAGGPNKIEASYLIRDQYSWGFDGGLWAVMDVSQSCWQ